MGFLNLSVVGDDAIKREGERAARRSVEGGEIPQNAIDTKHRHEDHASIASCELAMQVMYQLDWMRARGVYAC
jgi:hypothetical protein